MNPKNAFSKVCANVSCNIIYHHLFSIYKYQRHFINSTSQSVYPNISYINAHCVIKQSHLNFHFSSYNTRASIIFQSCFFITKSYCTLYVVEYQSAFLPIFIFNLFLKTTIFNYLPESIKSAFSFMWASIVTCLPSLPTLIFSTDKSNNLYCQCLFQLFI